MDVDPYAGMTDDQVLDRAAKALRKWSTLPMGTIQRSMQRAVFDSSMGELDRRAIAHVVATIGKMSDPEEAE
jgi:hypothetical protein